MGAGDPQPRSVLQLLDPDVAEAHGVAVILHLDRPLVAVLLVLGDRVRSAPAGSSGQHEVVVNDVAVVHDMELRLPRDVALLVEDRAVKGDVEGLPFAGLATRVDERLRQMPTFRPPRPATR